MAVDAIDLLPDGVVIADGAGRVTAVNRVAARMLGIDGAAAVGRELGDVARLSDHDDRAWLAVNTPYAGLRIRTAIPEQSWLLPDGTEVLVAARLHRSEPLGEVSAVAISLRSGRGRARLDRDRSDLVATVAHELRSPLTGVKGFVQALLNRWDMLSDEQRKLMLTTANTDADRLSRLIAELLDVARIDTGRLQIHRRPTDLALKAQRVHDSIAGYTSTPVNLVLEPDLPKIDADPDKVIQVLTNLVENAIRHGEGEVTVTVAAGEDPSHNTVSVSDSGEGIPEGLRKRIFTKFWTRGSGGGSGLGLYIVNGLVSAHGGRVDVGDSPAGGACITVTWPTVADDGPGVHGEQPGRSLA